MATKDSGRNTDAETKYHPDKTITPIWWEFS